MSKLQLTSAGTEVSSFTNSDAFWVGSGVLAGGDNLT
jgi:hypothetical protein